MKVKVAKTAGFCMGVKRALEIALEAAQAGIRPIFTHGPLIHNPQVLELLEKKGVRAMRDPSEVESGTVIVRAHGIAPQERARIEKKGVQIADATCPHVLRVQTIIKKHVEKGYTCVIVGDKGHAEVLGLLGFAGGRGYVVESLQDLEKIPPSEKMVVVAQTTQDRAFYDEVCKTLSQRFPGICIFDTICNSTSDRQAEVLKLAREVDAMVIVGGRGSANTNRLVNISRGSGKPTFHVECAADLDREAIKAFRVVGVTAGASTPTWLISEVVDALRSIAVSPSERIRLAFSWLFQALLVTCLYAAAGAACLCLASGALMGVAPRGAHLLIAAMAVLGLLLFNRVLERSPHADAPLFPAFYSRYGPVLLAFAMSSVAGALALAAAEGKWVFALVAACCVMGILYRLRIIPRPLVALLGHESLQAIPGTKELFLAGAWTVVVVMPVAVTEVGLRLSVLVAAAFAFIITFIRILALDVREIQWDAIVGRETVPTVLGLRATKILLGSLALLLTVVLLGAAHFGWASPSASFFLINIVYACAYLYAYHRRWIQGIVFEGIVDGNFVLSGLLAYWSMR